MTIAHFGSLDAQSLGPAVDAFARGALRINDVVERPVAIQRHALDTAEFPIDIFDTALAFGELCVLTGCAGLVGKEQGATEPLGAIAVGVVELVRRLHEQALLAARSAIGLARQGSMAVLVEGNRADAAVTGGALVHIPGIKGRIRRDMGRELPEGEQRALVQGAEIGHIVLVEGLGELR